MLGIPRLAKFLSSHHSGCLLDYSPMISGKDAISWADLTRAMRGLGSHVLPRILTQVCRDPSHPGFGCFDRNWWHYKIRDFPSIILQQGGGALAAASTGADRNDPALSALARASCLFWNKRAQRHGAFEEYYPWEQGFPPLAFSALAVTRMAVAGIVSDQEIEVGIAVAATQLLRRFEAKAANQQVAGLAALAHIRKIAPDLISLEDLDNLIGKTLALQHAEGWFQEYGGPDLGYLAVTIDCLLDAHDACGDPRLLDSALAAARFISSATLHGTAHFGMHNARNTDYLVPYGLLRLAVEQTDTWPQGALTVSRIFANCDHPGHPLAATDDRYLCHYIGCSILRAAAFLERSTAPNSLHAAPPAGLQSFRGSGHHVLRGDSGDWHLLISAKKGAILTLGRAGCCEFADFGWRIDDGSTTHITHWWSDAWESDPAESTPSSPFTLTVRGPFFQHRETESSPFKHIVLRIVSLFLGRKIIGRLKDALIFHRTPSPFRLERTITKQESALVIEDTIHGLDDPSRLTRAPRASKRHVASADSFHPHDLDPAAGFHPIETRSTANGSIRIRTAIPLPHKS